MLHIVKCPACGDALITSGIQFFPFKYQKYDWYSINWEDDYEMCKCEKGKEIREDRLAEIDWDIE